MCGLGGMYDSCGLNHDQVHEIIEMAKRSVERGRDATGFMNESHYWKVAVDSPRAVERSGFADWLETAGVWKGKKWLMFHTRKKSQGSEFQSVNNHPLIQRKVWIMHNGRVREPDYFGRMVVDTRSLGYMIDWGIDNNMGLLQAVRAANISFTGRASLIVTNGKEFVITRNDDTENKSPLNYYWNKEEDKLQFASTPTINGRSMIGNVGRKFDDQRVVQYELKPHQALWYSGEFNIRRVWHEETHGGDGWLVRRRLPRRMDTHGQMWNELIAQLELKWYR